MKKLILFIISLFMLAGCTAERKKEIMASENNFKINVILDTTDIIYAVSCEYYIDKEAIGGKNVMSAKAGNPLLPSDNIVFTFDDTDFKESPDFDKFSIRMFVSRNPDIYQEGFLVREKMIEIPSPVILNAEYGKVYNVRISGTAENGYYAK